MKTAVSIPDELFERVERLAERVRRSRSEVYTAALREYVARHSPDEITDAMTRVCDKVGTAPDEVPGHSGAARPGERRVVTSQGEIWWGSSSYTDSDIHGWSRGMSPRYCTR